MKDCSLLKSVALLLESCLLILLHPAKEVVLWTFQANVDHIDGSCSPQPLVPAKALLVYCHCGLWRSDVRSLGLGGDCVLKKAF